MTTKTIRQQIQDGVDARTAMEGIPLGSGLARSRAVLRMLGLDRERTSVEDAARAAYTPTGPCIADLEQGIRELRAEYVVSA